jgi:release factor glutamine methyltransferase
LKLKKALDEARSLLADRGIEDAPLEGELLLRHTLGVSRSQLYLDLDSDLSPEHEELYRSFIERRLRGEPSAYITGHREFYGLDFMLDRSVLIPRPESELLVEKAIEMARRREVATIVDVGTGCGAIAISLAVNLPDVRISATDLSEAALGIARGNAGRHGVDDRLHFIQGDMLEPVTEPVDLIVANMPYVRRSELAPQGPLSFEPSLALDGGPDGLEKIRILCRQAAEKLSAAGALLLEIGDRQAAAVRDILHNVFASAGVEVIRDLAGIERVVGVRLTPGP